MHPEGGTALLYLMGKVVPESEVFPLYFEEKIVPLPLEGQEYFLAPLLKVERYFLVETVHLLIEVVC